jgi:hypothetical protein
LPLPLARRAGVTLVAAISGSLILSLDGPSGGTVVRLDPVTASVWESADGNLSVSDLGVAASRRVGQLVDGDQVAAALRDLAAVGLVGMSDQPRDEAGRENDRKLASDEAGRENDRKLA